MSMIREAEQSLNRLNTAMQRNTAYARKKAKELLKRLIPQILLQSFAIIGTATGSYIFMSWLVQGVIRIESPYLSTLYETLGTLVLMILVLVSINTRLYRKKLQEINTLSEAISRVAGGDFDYKIRIRRRDPMTPVYEDFNRMCSELSGVQILRNDFINNYSHEFKTPIASINGFASLLLERKLPENEQKQYLEIIRDESERLTALARNTILLSSLSSTSIISDMEEYNLGEQLRQCAIIASRSWMEKKQDFSGDLPDVSYYGNRELMQHLWLNLIGNAIRYTGIGGTISVALSRESGFVKVAVQDNGEGMSEETCKHLFDPYYQGDTSHSGHGLGLGMSIAKRIVELCNGEILIESQPGLGSTFTILLPEKHTDSFNVN